MKNLNKVLAMLVVFMMVVSTVAFAGSFTDVADTSSYSTAIEVGTDLNLFKGYEDGTFAPEGEITRAEFAAIVVRLKGQEAQANGAKAATMFADVPADHWAAGYVNIAVQAGIINGYGDGNFGPEDQVEYQDAITMMVRALGYEPAIGAAGYPTGYLTKAGELGLTTNVNGTNGVAINRGAVAQIAFNALDVPLMTQSGYGTFTQYVVNDGYSATTGTTNVKKTLLSENHSIVKLQGIITSSTDSTSASTNITDKVYVNVTNTLYNKFKIGSRNMEVGDSDAMKFVGKKAIIFVEYNEFEDVCTIKSLYESNVGDSLVIDLADIEAYTAAKSGYYKDVTNEEGKTEEVWVSGTKGAVKYYATESKTTTVTIDPDADVYYNGVANASNLPSDSALIAMNGSMELALLDGQSTNADYDTIYITAYETFVVDEVKASAARVTNKIEGSKLGRIEYGEDDGDVRASLVGVDGAEMAWEDLKEFDVLMVKWAKTSAKNIYEAEVIDNKVSGTITSIAGQKGLTNRSVKVDGVEYEVAISAESEKAIKIGDEGTYYLDASNKIIYVDKATVKSGNYGYVIATAAAESGDLVAANQVKMITKDNALVVYNFAKKLKVSSVNAGSKEGSVLVSGKMLNSEKNDKGEYVVKEDEYTTATNVSIDDIDLSKLEDQIITYKVNSSDEITSIEVAKNVSRFDEDFFSAYANGTTVDMTAYDPDDMSFKVNGRRLYLAANTVVFNKDTVDVDDTEVVSLANLVEDQDLVDAILYDVDEDDVIGCVLLTTTNTIRGNNENATFVVKVGLDTNKDGDEIVYVTGYKGLEAVTYTSEDLDLATEAAKIGKLVVPTFNANGTVKALNVVSQGSIHDGKSAELSEYKGISGELTNIDGRIIWLGGTLGTESGTEYKVKSSANVYVYDNTSNAKVKFTVGESVGYFDYDADYGIYVDSDDINNNVTVYAYEVEGDIVDLVYYIH